MAVGKIGQHEVAVVRIEQDRVVVWQWIGRRLAVDKVSVGRSCHCSFMCYIDHVLRNDLLRGREHFDTQVRLEG